MMLPLSPRLIVVVFLQILFLSVSAQDANDHIFPASPRAKASIDFDKRGFLVNGRRTFIVSAGIEYARVPHELWEDRLLRLRRAGFNCVEIYTFWNFHEPQRGVFDFSGDHDLDAFLKLVKKTGLYAIVRVGPYYCAEWDNGGYPLWLKFEPGVRVREPNEPFEKYAGLFFDHLLPIVAANQIHHGGAVILVQLENEHPLGWGTIMPNSYFKYLQDKALSLGLEVPYFFSGLHHDSDPAGDTVSMDDPSRPNPWLSTEFWSVWYDDYGSTEKEARIYERRTWKIIAHGGNGYNYYMAHGGSNFAYTNNDEDAASYDYGAAVGQGGDLRPIYYSFKRMALFARSFQNILENSADGTDTYRDVKADTPVRVSARKSPSGNIVFLDNPSRHTAQVVIRTSQGLFRANGSPGKKVAASADTLLLDPGEIMPLVQDYTLAPGIQLTRSVTRILAAVRQGREITLLVYGTPGSNARLYFSAGSKAVVETGALNIYGPHIRLRAPITDSEIPKEYAFSAGGYRIRVLVMSRTLADRTWVIDSGGTSYIVCGPRYAGKMDMASLVTEDPLGAMPSFPVEVYTEGRVKTMTAAQNQSALPQPTPDNISRLISPDHWERAAATGAASTTFDDSHWKQSTLPLQMGADGDLTADAWYRTAVDVDSPGIYTLRVEGGDRATAFSDGKVAGSVNIKDGEIPFTLSKGHHVLAIFTAHDGRDKMPAYLGPIDSVDRKGLFGKALLVKGPPSISTLEGWKVLKVTKAEDIQTGPPSSGANGWQPYAIGQDPFDKKRGFGWFQAPLPELPPGATQLEIRFASVDENAIVFINGTKMIRHDGWNAPFDVLVNKIDTFHRPLLLTLFVENYSNEGGIDKPVRAGALSSPVTVTGWRMQGGTGGLPGAAAWSAAGGTPASTPGDTPASTPGDTPASTPGAATSGHAPDTASAGPCWWRTSFQLPTAPPVGTVMRVIPTGLGHGSVWVNGHNLGRYPEKIPINGLYIPECWMRAGVNTLEIFDEDGRDARQVSILEEITASRTTQLFY